MLIAVVTLPRPRLPNRVAKSSHCVCTNARFVFCQKELRFLPLPPPAAADVAGYRRWSRNRRIQMFLLCPLVVPVKCAADMRQFNHAYAANMRVW